MEKISLEQFIAEIETTFSNYADTNDIDHQSIKTWLIQALRKFGKNICDKHETLVEIKNYRSLLPETFKSLIFAVKVDFSTKQEQERTQLINEKRYIENPAVWDEITQQYLVNYCETKIVTEKTFVNKESNKVSGIQILNLEDYISKDVLDVDCLNLHPSVRNTSENRISIVNRTMNANVKNMFVYLKYNSLPCTEDGEIAVPIFTTGEIYDYLLSHIERKLVKNLILSGKASSEIKSMLPLLQQEESRLFPIALAEAKSFGLKKGWDRKFARQNMINRKRLGL